MKSRVTTLRSVLGWLVFCALATWLALPVFAQGVPCPSLTPAMCNLMYCNQAWSDPFPCCKTWQGGCCDYTCKGHYCTPAHKGKDYVCWGTETVTIEWWAWNLNYTCGPGSGQCQRP